MMKKSNLRVNNFNVLAAHKFQWDLETLRLGNVALCVESWYAAT